MAEPGFGGVTFRPAKYWLSRRELTLLRFLRDDANPALVAERLNERYTDVAGELVALFGKMGVATAEEAVCKALLLGLEAIW